MIYLFDNINTVRGERIIEGGNMQGAKGLFGSRRFWTMLIYTIVSVALYFVGKYFQVAAEDVKFLIAALLPIALALVAAYTVDDMQAARLEAVRMQMDAVKQ